MFSPEILKKFSCTGCGECCRWGGYVLLTDNDITVLARYMGLSEEDFIERHTRLSPNRSQLALLDKEDGSCALLEGSRCSVYEARPRQCSSFPFDWIVTEGCPALDNLKVLQKEVEKKELNP